jgi:SAM-dependent methyltransferase
MKRADHGMLLARSEQYYTGKFAEHGATAAGVDWNGVESQELRFEQLLRVATREGVLSILDYGCGYGALAAYLLRSGRELRYLGFDVSRPMIDHAREEYRGVPGVAFTADESELEEREYAVASGVFNVKLDAADDVWAAFVGSTVAELARLGAAGFALNMLTSYSDTDKMRKDLYYGDPVVYFRLCKSEHARYVALLHDYGLWEFTILARHDGAP